MENQDQQSQIMSLQSLREGGTREKKHVNIKLKIVGKNGVPTQRCHLLVTVLSGVPEDEIKTTTATSS